MSLLNALSPVGITFLSIFGALFVIFVVYLCFVPLKTYFVCLFSGCYIPTIKLVGLKGRKLDVKEIASLYISAKKAGLKISLKDIEKTYQAEVNLKDVIEAMTLFLSAKTPIDFDRAVAIEMATKNLVNLAKDSLVSKTEKIENILATTSDDFEVAVCVNISFKANLENFESSLGLDELKNSLSAYIIDKVASSKKEELFSKPNEFIFSDINLEEISEKTMFSLEGVSLANISVSKDLNVEKEIKSAEKEKIYASIEAERMKNAEEIRLLQTKTKIEDMKASVLEAEADVPRALSSAIKEGRFSIMDYYKLMNLQADTALRRAIIGDEDDETEGDE